jgi:flavin reductase (DIM6/NTAB) family NADH-FMN oxidoreductase RutF
MDIGGAGSRGQEFNRDAQSMTHCDSEKNELHPPISGDSSFGPETFRNIMRHFAGAVCVVSTSGPAGKHGLAATAVCSVCAEPPTILAIVNRGSRTHPHIRQNGTFTVNILSEQQADIAKLMSSKSDDQFAQVPHKDTDEGAILIEDTLGQFHCRVVADHDVGTHTIFIGSILSGNVGDGAPLIYYDASFGALRPL